jgi:hypothetical protein
VLERLSSGARPYHHTQDQQDPGQDLDQGLEQDGDQGLQQDLEPDPGKPVRAEAVDEELPPRGA